jgi:5-methylthioadenosine/S-adenosylhomocysteine deaminase
MRHADPARPSLAMRGISRRTFLRGTLAIGAVGAGLVASDQLMSVVRQASWRRAQRSRLVLRGRVVTFRTDVPIVDRGAVYIDQTGAIESIGSASDPEPSGYAGAPHVDSGGVIYPGLIDLHNHPYYDLRSLWTPPRSTPYTRHQQWQQDAPYQKDIAYPHSPLWVYWRLAAEECLKYVEMKALVGGVTTLQGLGQQVLGGTRPREGWLLRHVEQERRGPSPVAVDFVLLPPVADPYAVLRQTMSEGTVVIHHLGEGSDPDLSREFESLLTNGCVGPRLVGIHANSLSEEQFQRWGRQGGTVVWSPMSNLWLYDQTTDVVAARQAGLRICLGPDWSISGSKHLLGELKVADLWNRTRLGGFFSDLDLCQMATSNAAEALGLENRIGRIAEGLRADLVVTSNRTADPYRNLIESTERDILLVVSDGRARYGTPDLLAQAGTLNLGSLLVGDVSRAVSLPDPTVTSSILDWSDVVGTLDRLRSALKLAEDVPGSGEGDVTQLDPLTADRSYFQTLAAASIPGKSLGGLRDYYRDVPGVRQTVAAR